MALTTTVGNVHLDEVMGFYQISTQEGLIYGKILLTGGSNIFATQSGSIDLVVLDEIAAEMILKTDDGAISLRLPKVTRRILRYRSKARTHARLPLTCP